MSLLTNAEVVRSDRVGIERHGVGLSDIGRRRSANEDAFYCDDLLGLYVVADGMGGHAAGEVASAEAVDQVRGMVVRSSDVMNRVAGGATDEPTLRQAIRVLESAVQAATYMVFGLAQHEPVHKGMGTTVSALCICGGYAMTAQVGDSRIYMVREGEATLLTEDHTLVAWQLKQGLISEDEAKVSPHRNVITRAVGSKDYVQVDTHFFSLQAGDSFLVCSDGLHGYLQPDEISPIVALGPEAAARRFISLANQRGGKDNITAIVVSVK